MKKSILLIAAAFGMMTAQAQETAQAISTPKFTDNWQIGLDGGVLTPLTGQSFIGAMRGGFGLHVDKMVSPAFGVGVEGVFGVNTSAWEGVSSMNGVHRATVIDSHYVGAYGKLNLFNLFCGYKCDGRKFDIDAIAGAGWGRYYGTKGAFSNHFATKAGLSFNYNATKNLTVSLKPSVIYNMSDVNVNHASAAYDIRNAQFSLFASVSYNINPGFNCVVPRDQAEIDGLNAQINALRGQLDGCKAANAACNAKVADLQKKLADCEARKAVVKEVISDKVNSVRYVFFKVGKSTISADQQPNIEMIAKYLKNHPNAKVVVKGYASKDGSKELNEKLAVKRAEAVKNSLVKKYKVAEDRIQAEGNGIGEMFEENDWNRVAICTLDGK